MVNWLESKSLPISMPILREKVRKIAKELVNEVAFKCL